MTVQARFYVAEVAHYATGSGSRPGYSDPAPHGKVILRPVTRGEANAEWASATPSGSIEMVIHGQALKWFFERLTQEVAITFQDCASEETPT